MKTRCDESAREPVGHRIGVTGEREPEVTGEIGFDLRSDEAMLGDEMAAALATLRHVGAAGRIEEHHRFSPPSPRPWWHRTKARRPRPSRFACPGEAFMPRERIGNPCPIDMHGNAAGVGDVGELPDLIRPIDPCPASVACESDRTAGLT